MEYILVLVVGGYPIDIGAFLTMRDCSNHSLTVTRVLKQIKREDYVRCEQRPRRPGDPAPPR
jgi:hypothetical protein